MSNDNTADLVLKSINIVDVISSYISLSKSGSNYKARCPFHEERTASFNVSESKQIYKCFGCQKAGNAITFVRDYEKISFYEALQKLADKAGITLKNSTQTKVVNTKRDLIYTIYELANDFFISNLKKHGVSAQKYLEQRQISSEIAQKFSLGYSLDSYSGLKSYLSRNYINSDIFSETGLFRVKEDGSDTYDLFRDRLMFPIHSVNGRVVAFGGRALNPEQEKQYKYVNSPTTDIYTKGKELYGLYITKFDISKKGAVFITEGYLDFLRLYEKGITNSVASLGTALTKEQINLLSRYTKNLILLYDGDNPGIKAAVKAATLAVQLGCTPKIMLLPDKQDPDSYLLNHSVQDFYNLSENATSLVNFVQQNNYLFSDTRQAIQMLMDITPEIEDHIARELYIQDVSDTFNITEQHLRTSVSTNQFQNRNVTNNNIISYKFEEERKMLKFMLKNSDMIKRIAQELDPSYFINNELRYMYNFLKDEQNEDLINNPPLLIEQLEQNHAEELTKLFFDEDYLDNIDELIRQLKLRKYEYDLRVLNDKIAHGNHSAENLEKKYFLKKEIEKLSKNVVRKIMY